MTFRYFYNSSNDIVGFTRYSSVCMVNSIDNQTEYVDSEVEIDVTQYKIDPDTGQLTVK